MNFLDIFAGIGGFRFGLERAGHECVGHVEIDKYARKSYEAIHNPEGEWVRNDITAITDEEWRELRGTVDIIAGGFPCQAFSIAGKRGGFEDTRGTLFFDIARAAKEIEPSYLFLENVKGLFSHEKGRTFGTIIQTLDELGFVTEWGLFNSKFWGVPQNRERVFIVATRKDKWEKPILFDLLKQQELNGVDVKLRDVLETEVDEKFYLSKEQTDRLVFNMGEREKPEDEIKILAHHKNFRRNTQVFDKDGLTETLDTGQGGGRGHYTMEEPFIVDDQGRLNKKLNPMTIAPTLRAQSHGNEPKVVETRAIKDKILMRETDDGFHLCRNDEKKSSIQGTHVTYPDGTSHCLSAAHKPMTITAGSPSFRIRKLTPRECFRLQGFPDWAFDRAKEAGVSDSQLYKQAGNSVTVNVIEAIGRKFAMEDHS